MELLNVWPVLVRRRRLVAAGALLALVAGLAAAGLLPGGPEGHRRAESGVAQVRVLVDQPRSLAADVAAPTDAIGAQAALLADLLTSPSAQREIARTAGVPATTVAVRNPAAAAPALPSPLTSRAAEAAAHQGGPLVLTVGASTAVPIVTIDAAAGDAGSAARLARAGEAVLGRLAAARSAGPAYALVIRSLGPAQSATVPAGSRLPGDVGGLAVAAAAFVLLCCGIVVFDGALEAWRRSAPAPGA